MTGTTVYPKEEQEMRNRERNKSDAFYMWFWGNSYGDSANCASAQVH